jgi:Tat protein secretion system quality control protein TatD with DNase activity
MTTHDKHAQHSYHMILPFDSHNHVHMGPTSPQAALLLDNKVGLSSLSGMAIMSTHPRDWDLVARLAVELQRPHVFHTVPCFGVHPWFLHQVLCCDDEEEELSSSSARIAPVWVHELEQRLIATPHSIVGEIGLDGFHFDPVTRNLVSSMELQVKAFTFQMELAARLQRPVSVHAVQSVGPLLETLGRLKQSKHGLPPKTYFHAFAGKIGTVEQLLSLCGRKIGMVYFGFAPVVNFRSPKTADVVRHVGIDRLVLESDHEDATLVSGSIQGGIQFIADALGCSIATVVERTTHNAYALYNLKFDEEK